MNDNQKLAGLIGAYLGLVVVVATGLLYLLEIDLVSATIAAVTASVLIFGFAITVAGKQSVGGTAAETFFAKSVAGNSRAVLVISVHDDLQEVMYRLKAAGLQPSMVTI